MLASLLDGCVPAGGAPAFFPLMADAWSAGQSGVGARRAPLRAPDAQKRVKAGTGFFVSPEELVVTSAHLVSGCAGISIGRSRDTMRRVQLAAIDPRRDIALLSTGSGSLQVAIPTDQRRPAIGEPVALLGYAVDADRPLAPALIRGVFAGAEASPEGAPLFVVRASVPNGASGGLVVDRDGAMVGMVIGYYTDSPGFGVVIPGLEIDRFLATHGVQLGRKSVRATPRSSDERILFGASVLVECEPGSSERHPRAGVAESQPYANF